MIVHEIRHFHSGLGTARNRAQSPYTLFPLVGGAVGGVV